MDLGGGPSAVMVACGGCWLWMLGVLSLNIVQQMR